MTSFSFRGSVSCFGFITSPPGCFRFSTPTTYTELLLDAMGVAEKHQPPPPQQEEEIEESQEDQEHQEQEEDEHDESPPPRSPPSKLARLLPDDDPAAGLVTTAVASPLGLGLGLGLSVGEDTTTAAAAAKSAFTFMQMHEFHHQSLIFKHMVAGITVPVHFILPIWKSVAASYGPHHYPSSVGLGNLCYDFKNSMEPEPGRCRRTDGKKWRCSRDVVPDQKYCERHMHRGRNRSRKIVEAPAVSTVSAATASTTTAINLSISVPDTPGSVLSDIAPYKS